MFRIFAVLFLAVLGSPPLLTAQNARPWEVVELSFEAARDYSNPYVEGLPDRGAPLVRAVFTGESGAARGMRYTLAGFWDGARTWRIRFAPPAAGEWAWSTVSADSGLNARKGGFSCREWEETDKIANPTRRGFVKVAQGGGRPGRHFEYSDGAPFLWVGDTWWNWSKRGIQFRTFQRLADDRSAKGFTVGQIFFAGNDGLLDKTYDMPNLERIRAVEQMISYANSVGITVWIHPWWSREGLNQRVGEAKMRRWWRYAVHRLGAHNVIWVLAGEYNMNGYGGLGLPFFKDLGAMVRQEDPYGRIIGAHPTPPGWSGGADAPQWSTGEAIHAEPWLDYNQSQTGHGRWRNEMIPSIIAADYARSPAKPTVVTEPWYEFIEGNPTAMDVRLGIWSAFLSGAAGHSYGGGHVWWAHVPEAPSSQGSWPLDKSFETNTLDYPGAISMSVFSKFLKSIDWWRLEPHPELVSDNPSRFCAAVPGERYLIYLRYGGWVRLDLRSARESDSFEFTWLDPADGKPGRSGVTTGGAVREFSPPGDYPGQLQYKDWLLHVRRVSR
ncbi:MAG: DUF4038 domain-containing protein [Bryobacterales bacterium]|nr:DUF4038 domain-containing protein [Bryobacterales bacterium]